jgi:hypothetical protein
MSNSIGANIDYSVSPKTFTSFNLAYTLTPQESETPYTGSVYTGSRGYDFDAVSK